MWITPSLRIGSFKRGWGIYLTLGVGNMLTGNMLTLDRFFQVELFYASRIIRSCKCSDLVYPGRVFRLDAKLDVLEHASFGPNS